MHHTTRKSGDFPAVKPAPPVLLQRRSQLSLRALFFLQMQAAIIMLFVTLAVGRQTATVPVMVSTFISVTMFTCLGAIWLSHHFAMRCWWGFGPAVGVAVGLIASSLILSPRENFSRRMFVATASSTFLVAMSVWQGRYLAQEEPDSGNG